MMMARKLCAVAVLAGFAVVATPSRASADWYVTPFAGLNFGGNAAFGGNPSLIDSLERKIDVGASLGWMGAGIIGAEVRFRLLAKLLPGHHHQRRFRPRRQQRGDVDG